MRACFRSVAVWLLMAALPGCAGDTSEEVRPIDPWQEGWVRAGEVVVSSDLNQDVITADHLPGIYRSLRFDSSGPARIERIIISFANAAVLLPEQGLMFDTTGSQILELPGDQRVEQIMVIHSGGRPVVNTMVTVWLK